MVILGVVLAGLLTRSYVVASYHFEKQYGQFWNLADKSSTISAKAKYVSEFVSSLRDGYAKGEFAGHDAIFLETPNNSFESNLQALITLSDRLSDIQKMSPSSFEYNTAIQQITAQEQGEATAMLGVFTGCYCLSNYVLIWDWIGGCLILFTVVLLFIGVLGAMVTWDE